MRSTTEPVVNLPRVKGSLSRLILQRRRLILEIAGRAALVRDRRPLGGLVNPPFRLSEIDRSSGIVGKAYVASSTANYRN